VLEVESKIGLRLAIYAWLIGSRCKEKTGEKHLCSSSSDRKDFEGGVLPLLITLSPLFSSQHSALHYITSTTQDNKTNLRIPCGRIKAKTKPKDEARKSRKERERKSRKYLRPDANARRRIHLMSS